MREKKTLTHKGMVDGIAAGLEVVGKGTIKWKIEDDKGEIRTISLVNSLYVPKSPVRVLSPQHWA